MCGWNISCNDFGVARDCSDSCESGCFCSNGTILEDGVCVHPDTCSSKAIKLCFYINLAVYESKGMYLATKRVGIKIECIIP